MSKFLRNFELTIGKFESDEVITIKPPYTIDFDVDRNDLSRVNASVIRIYNLSEQTRNWIYKDEFDTSTYRKVVLKVGYGDNIATIFQGNMMRANSTREGVNFITTLEGTDGGFAIVNGQFVNTFPNATKRNNILESIIAQTPKLTKGKIGTFKNESKRGIVVDGNVGDLLKEHSDSKYFIDNEHVYCLNENECIAGTVAVIEAESGLVSIPKKEQTIVEFEMLLEPGLLVGQVVELKSQTNRLYNGTYKVIGFKHHGTISEAVSGKCTSTVRLWIGEGTLQVIE